uniref:Uncharacterized protein n=1 Tax=Tanacetum cinerariifolium TaxID=118510 RepID=A0A699I5Z4_TANCI|nr:hypothetical protein [Tanacetum cinerariifolium]GEZ24719.1 hypothetical protein [Tanacetum cinerariifolium]
MLKAVTAMVQQAMQSIDHTPYIKTKIELIKPFNSVSVGNVTAVAFSDTSDKIYSGGIDNVVKVWDLRRNKVTMTLEGHQNMITDNGGTPSQRRTEPGQVWLLLMLARWIVIVFGGDDGGGRAPLEADAFLAEGEELYICHH